MRSLRPVVSSTIDAIGHDGQDLWVLFKSGKLYRYTSVPSTLFEQFKTSASKGKFFAGFIKEAFPFSESNEPYLVRESVSIRHLLPGPSYGF